MAEEATAREEFAAKVDAVQHRLSSLQGSHDSWASKILGLEQKVTLNLLCLLIAALERKFCLAGSLVYHLSPYAMLCLCPFDIGLSRAAGCPLLARPKV